MTTMAEWVEQQAAIRKKMDSMDPTYKPKSLQDYFEYCARHFIFEHAIMSQVNPVSLVTSFYIHPARVAGPTCDYNVTGNILYTANLPTQM
jgi:hypothetical protein